MFVYTEGWKKMDIKPEIQYDISLYLVLFKCYLIPVFFSNYNAFTKICEQERNKIYIFEKNPNLIFFVGGGGRHRF